MTYPLPDRYEQTVAQWIGLVLFVTPAAAVALTQSPAAVVMMMLGGLVVAWADHIGKAAAARVCGPTAATDGGEPDGADPETVERAVERVEDGGRA